jgi:hypothetical protein
MDSPQRTSLVGVVLAVALALGVGACDPVDVPGGAALAPSPFSSSFIGAMLVPETLAFVSVPIFGCPHVAPFRSSFSLVIDQRRGPDVFFHEAELRFVDVSGVASPLFFDRSGLARMFGTTLVSAGTTRSFAFQPAFGCGFVSTPRSLSARLLFLDRGGSALARTVTAQIDAGR